MGISPPSANKGWHTEETRGQENGQVSEQH